MAVPSGGLLADSQPWIQWSWVSRNRSQIESALSQHIELTLIAVGIGLAISLPLGYAAWRWRVWEKPIYGLTGILFTIPSLALFAFLIPITGLGTETAEIGLVSYTLLILIRGIVSGLDSVPPEVRDAARGLGYGHGRQLIGVDLPLAAPAIVAGIRLAMVTTIGLVTVAGVIGAGGGLGTLIYNGQQYEFRTEVVLGAGLSIILAAVFDLVLIGAERLATPWTRKAVAR